MSKNLSIALHARVVQRAGIAAALALAALATPLAQAQAADGLRIAKDPVTGELRAPTAEENKALDALQAKRSGLSTARAAGTPTLHVHKPGAKFQGARMPDDLMSYSMVAVRADGSLEEVCVDGSHAAEATYEQLPKNSAVAALETE